MDNEVCYYVYNKEKQEAEATTVKVEYETKCEEETQKVCPEKQYGHQGYCKTVKNQVGQSCLTTKHIEYNPQVCYNVPVVSPDKTGVTVGYPVPEKKCENKPVKLPKVKCDEVSVSFNLMSLSFRFSLSFRRRNASSCHSPLRRQRPLRSAPQSWGTLSVSKHLSSYPGRSVYRSRRHTRLLLHIMFILLHIMYLHLLNMLLFSLQILLMRDRSS